MANFQQSNTFGQYFGYGTGVQYDGTGSQNKWGSGTNTGTGSQAQTSQTQNQQQMYQAAAQNYAAASGFYGNQAYGQQQSYSGSVDSNMTMAGTRNTPNTGTGNNSSSMGNKSLNSFGNATSTGSANTNTGTSSSGTSSYSTGYGHGASGTGGSFGNSATENKTNLNVQSQMLGGSYGNTGQNSGMTNFNSSLTTNMSMPPTTQAQNFGSTATPVGTGDALNQLSQISQMFGNGTNFGSYPPGDGSGGNFATGYNQQAFNTGMMTLLQQTLMQQAAGGDVTGAGSFWGMADGDGGFYAPPVDGNYQSGMAIAGSMQGKKGKKWTGKDNTKRQDFYGNRFAQMFTGAPGILGQSQTGTGKVKRLMDGVRINIKGEKVMDVEIPLTLYSRWGQLRKFFSKQDTEVARHLLEFHDEMCEECLEREQRKKKGYCQSTEQVVREVKEDKELTEEDLMLQQVMGFGNFSTTREAMVEGNQGDAAANAAVPAIGVKSTSSSTWEARAGFIGPTKPDGSPQDSQDKSENDREPALSEEEKLIMEKLGWSVFNKKKNKKEEDDDDDDEEKMDDGGKDGSAAKGH